MDCLSRETNTIFPTLRSRWKNFFPKWLEQRKKFSSFGKETARWMFFVQPSLLKSFALITCRRDTMKNSALGYFCKSKYSKMLNKLRDIGEMINGFHSSSWNFSSPHYVTYFVRQSFQKLTQKVTSKVPFRKTSWENIHFCVFTRDLYV